MTERVWRKGPPPHVGWWNASHRKALSIWRWWNGACWSEAATPDCNKEIALTQSTKKAQIDLEIKWTYYYPANARVPRINPDKGKSL